MILSFCLGYSQKYIHVCVIEYMNVPLITHVYSHGHSPYFLFLQKYFFSYLVDVLNIFIMSIELHWISLNFIMLKSIKVTCLLYKRADFLWFLL